MCPRLLSPGPPQGQCQELKGSARRASGWRRRPARDWAGRAYVPCLTASRTLSFTAAPASPPSPHPEGRLAARWNRRLTWSAAGPRGPGWASARVTCSPVFPARDAAESREIGQRRGWAGERPPPGPAAGLAVPPSRPWPGSPAAPAKGAAPLRRTLSVCFSCPTDVSQNIGHMFRGNKLGMSANTLGLRWLFQLPHGRIGGGGLPPCVAPDPQIGGWVPS